MHIVLEFLVEVVSITCKEQMLIPAATIDSSLQLSISGKALGTASSCFHTAKIFEFMYSQKRNCAVSVTNSTFMCLWVIYEFPPSGHLFSRSRIGGPIRGIHSIDHSQKHECRNRDCSRIVPFLGIYVCFKFSVFCLCSASQNKTCSTPLIWLLCSVLMQL